MEILLNCFPNHTFIITTHSNHIMDIMNYCTDVSLFKFSKNDNKIFIEEMDSSYYLLLSEMGVNASASLLSNCTIWVEGISDRIYLKKYIEMIFSEKNKQNKFKEGIHYSFVEYGGSNLTHWNFDSEKENLSQINSKYLSHNVFLIVDNDGTSGKRTIKGSLLEKEKNKRKLEEILGDRFFELKSREIENLIKLEVLEQTLKEDNHISTLTRVKYTGPSWDGRFNQNLISTPNVYLGKFIDQTYQLEKKYSAQNGNTIRAKAEFANKICRNIHSINDLSEQAIELGNIICDFIEKNNN